MIIRLLKELFSGFGNPPFFTFDCHCQGYSHIKTGKVCQDYALSYNAKHYAVAIISDGHGGDDYFRSDIGSKLAAETAMECAKEFVNCFVSENFVNNEMFISIKEDSDKILKQLETSIISKWRAKTYEHYKQNSFSEKEMEIMSDKAKQKYEESPETRYVKAYGATLLVAVVVKKYFWLGLQLGDGKCVALFKNDVAEHPTPTNEKCFLNQTTSLCDENPLEEFRHSFETEIFPQWLFVCCDGIEDSFKDNAQLNDFYKEVTKTFKKPNWQNWQKAIKELADYLPTLSQKGSGDDMSISGIFNN